MRSSFICKLLTTSTKTFILIFSFLNSSVELDRPFSITKVTTESCPETQIDSDFEEKLNEDKDRTSGKREKNEILPSGEGMSQC